MSEITLPRSRTANKLIFREVARYVPGELMILVYEFAGQRFETIARASGECARLVQADDGNVQQEAVESETAFAALASALRSATPAAALTTAAQTAGLLP